MKRTASIWLLAATFSVACATSPAATPDRPTPTPAATPPSQPPSTSMATSSALNPVGTFDYTAIGPDGSALPGTFTISGSPGAYTGRIERQGAGATDITSIAVNGQTLTLVSSINEGPVTLTLNFTGNDFAGKWAIQGMEGTLTGKRR
jgi:hypothetical protein